MAIEEIRNITWGLNGAQLSPWQAAQRLYKAGFKDVKLLAIAWAVMEAESGGYLKAFHHNVKRDENGLILRDADGKMIVLSTDLGFIQKNIVHPPNTKILVQETASQEFVEQLFKTNSDLADGQKSANIAWAFYKLRGWQPWYAYSNESYKRSLPRGCEAVANFLGKVLLNNSKLVKRLDA